MSKPSPPISKDTQSLLDMYKAIEQAIGEGYGFVPLIGSGLSYASGIPIGPEVNDYLYYCLRRAFGDTDDEETPWDPRTSKWPQVKPIPESRAEWCRRTMEEVTKGPDKLKWEAVGSLADWRTSLQFLSRLTRRKERFLELGTPDYRVIDSFFLHLTKGRRPNAGNIMLAHLGEPLGIQTILTTNFDSLIESSFERLGMPLAVYDVHQRSVLPEPSSVLAQRSIIKLHGFRYGLRADFTLDENPSREDLERFAGYFAGWGTATDRKHLIVMGVSGNDRRTLRLIRYALRHNKGMKVFWLCYSNDEFTVVNNKFRGRGRRRVFLAKHREPALFMLELYQRICLSLPPAGADYPAFWHVPPHPYIEPGKHVPAFGDLFKKLKRKFRRIRRARPPKILCVEGAAGISSVAAKLYGYLCDGWHCIWLDLDDFATPGDFFVGLREAVAAKVGVASAMPPVTIFDPREGDVKEKAEQCKQELDYFLDRSMKPMVVFLQGRDGFGTNAGGDEKPWDNTDMRGFSCLLPRIRHLNVRYVLLVRREQWGKLAINNGSVDVIKQESPCISFKSTEIAHDVLEWLDKWKDPKVDRQVVARFLYAMTLFRHSRHSAALCSWALTKRLRETCGDRDFDKYSCDQGNHWLKVLMEKRAIRRKPGGFAWMHQELKEVLRQSLETGRINSKGVYYEWLERLELPTLRAECHQGIADWYAKLFRSSNDPLAAVESVYHDIICHNCARNELGTVDYPMALRMRETALNEAINTLKLARSRILSCGYFKSTIGVIDILAGMASQAKGDAIANSAKSTQLSEGECSEEENRLSVRAAELERVCHELIRDFWREVGDFDKAEEENRKLRPLAPHESSISILYEKGLYEKELECETASYLTGLRCYDKAECTLQELLRGLGLNLPAKLEDMSLMRGRGWEWAAARETRLGKVSQQHYVLAVRSLRRLLFQYLLRAQVSQFKTQWGVADEAKSQREYLMCAEGIYAMATQIMRYVDDPEFLQKENAFIRTHYAVAVSNLGRYHEAHRRLNEATGYLSQSQRRDDPIAWAVIDLRRAEVYLDQADMFSQAFLSDQARETVEQLLLDEGVKVGDGQTEVTIARRLISLLDSAHLCLERAHDRLAGHRKDIWWWTWLYELRITLCLFLSRMPGDPCGMSEGGMDVALVCRSCSKRYERLERLFRESSRLIRMDVLRQARLADLLLFSMNTLRTDFPKLTLLIKMGLDSVASERLSVLKGDPDYAIDEKVLEYVNNIRAAYKLDPIRC